jgi:flagella basal body P-ring formation protein FlgA
MIVFLFSLMLGAVAAQGDVREVTVEGDIIRLGDVVSLDSWDARSGVELARAPEPGRARRFHDYELVSKVRGAGYAEDGLQLPAEVLVRRASRRLEEDEVRTAVEDALRERFPRSATSIVELNVPPTDLATGPVELSATIPSNFSPNTTTSVRIDIAGSDYARSVHVRTVLALAVSQPVLRHDIRAQTMIRPADVEWKVVPLESSAASILDAGDLEGFVAKHDLAQGSILTEGVLYSPIMVRRGENVSVEARVGNVAISAVMEAEESGRYGDVIEVGHLSGNGRTRVRIVGPGRVAAVQGRNQ